MGCSSSSDDFKYGLFLKKIDSDVAGISKTTSKKCSYEGEGDTFVKISGDGHRLPSNISSPRWYYFRLNLNSGSTFEHQQYRYGFIQLVLQQRFTRYVSEEVAYPSNIFGVRAASPSNIYNYVHFATKAIACTANNQQRLQQGLYSLCALQSPGLRQTGS